MHVDDKIREVLKLNAAGTLPLGQTDFYYRNLVPKSIEENLAFREKVLKLGYEKEEYAYELWVMCSRDILFSINTFGWTLDPKNHQKQPVRPFITYAFQDRAILELQQCVGKEDVAVPKTREQGASWICLLVLEHYWRFVPNQLFLLASRKAELVEGDERSLFAKLDWYHSRLPIWLKPRIRPKIERTAMHLLNPDNGSRIDGEATVENLGTGDRRSGILLDEFGKMEKAPQVDTSTRDVTSCRIFNSTPYGRYGTGKGFYDRIRNPSTRKIFLHWSEHPLKNSGLYKLVNGEKVPLPADYDWRNDYDFKQLTFHGDNKPRSDWYDKECLRENNKRMIAQELDIDFLGSSERFADDEVIAYAEQQTVRPPQYVGRLAVDVETCEPKWNKVHGGEMELWCPLGGFPARPPRDPYSVGADISYGTGGAFSSNSAIVVFNRRTGEQVAKWASNRVPVEKFARLAIGVCKWFWDALMVPEVNGPGGTAFLNIVKDIGYWNVWHRRTEMVESNEISKKLGYQNQDGGYDILTKLQDAMREKRATIRSEAIPRELLEYEIDMGKLIHAGSKASDAGSDKGKAHGDVAIAAGCAWLGVHDEKVDEPQPEEEVSYPAGTIGHRLREQQREEEMSAQSDWSW